MHLPSALRELPRDKREAMLAKLGGPASAALRGSWRYFWARPEQLAPGTPGAADDRRDWTYWICLSGRGWGKTKAGAEWVCERAKQPGQHIALVAATADDARKTMLSSGIEWSEGASGILAVSPPDFRPLYEPSKRTVTWPNGTVATLYTAAEPDRLRGPQHHAFWADEVAAWARCQDAWDMLLFGLRLGSHPQGCVTTTPRPIPLLKNLLKDPRTVISRGKTRDNAANLAPDFLHTIVSRYEGTRLGRQELEGIMLEDVPGALWRPEMIEATRLQIAPQMQRVVVAIDPAVSSSETSDETGIVVAGIANCRCKGPPELHGFILADESGKYSPNEWAQKAVGLYHRWQCDRIIAEVNNGGALVEVNLRTVGANLPYKAIHASHGKRARAEPVLGLYEQLKIHHVGVFPALEDQMCGWDASDKNAKSPDRIDSMVYAISEMLLGVPVGKAEVGRLNLLAR